MGNEVVDRPVCPDNVPQVVEESVRHPAVAAFVDCHAGRPQQPAEILP